jgi:hypothetical protein
MNRNLKRSTTSFFNFSIIGIILTTFFIIILLTFIYVDYFKYTTANKTTKEVVDLENAYKQSNLIIVNDDVDIPVPTSTITDIPVPTSTITDIPLLNQTITNIPSYCLKECLVIPITTVLGCIICAGINLGCDILEICVIAICSGCIG